MIEVTGHPFLTAFLGVCIVLSPVVAAAAALNRVLVRPIRDAIVEIRELIRDFPDVRAIVADHLEHDHPNNGDRRSIDRLIAVRRLRGNS